MYKRQAEVAARSADRRAVEVTDDESASAAVLAALDGARLLVNLRLTGSARVRFVDDLGRVGSVDHRIGPTPLDELSADELAVLRELATGASLGEVADRLHLSRRTADRRLASARSVLGATSTAEAVATYAELTRG